MREQYYENVVRIEYERAEREVQVCRNRLQWKDGKEKAYYLIALRELVRCERVAKIKAYEAIVRGKHVPAIDVMIGGILQMKTDLQKESGIEWSEIYRNIPTF